MKINTIELLPEVKDNLIEKLTIKVPLSAVNEEMITEISSLAKSNPGKTKLYFYVRDEDGQMYVNLFSRSVEIAVRKDFVNYLKSQPVLDYKIN